MENKIIKASEVTDEMLEQVSGGGEFSTHYKFVCPSCFTDLEITRESYDMIGYCPCCDSYPEEWKTVALS